MRAAIALGLVLAACGGGSSKPKDTTPEEKAPREEPAAPEPTGAMECDALIARTYCAYSKSGDAVPPDAEQMFADQIQGWRDALASEDTRQVVIDACKMSLDGGYPGFSAIGCWMMGDDYDAYAPASSEDDPSTPDRDFTFASTGNATCDALITKTFCMYQQTPEVPAEAIKAFQDAVKLWTESLDNEATRQATIDACQMSLEGAQPTFEQMGCW